MQNVTALPTLNPPLPQFHRIETWLSCTTLIPRYLLHLASYVISEPPPKGWSILVSGAIFISLLWTPLLLIRHRTIAYPIETFLPTYIALDEFPKFRNSRDIYVFHSWDNPSWFPLVKPHRCQLTPYPFVSTMKIRKGERQPHHEAMVQRSEDFKYDGANSSRSATKIEKTR